MREIDPVDLDPVDRDPIDLDPVDRRRQRMEQVATLGRTLEQAALLREIQRAEAEQASLVRTRRRLEIVCVTAVTALAVWAFTPRSHTGTDPVVATPIVVPGFETPLTAEPKVEPGQPLPAPTIEDVAAPFLNAGLVNPKVVNPETRVFVSLVANEPLKQAPRLSVAGVDGLFNELGQAIPGVSEAMHGDGKTFSFLSTKPAGELWPDGTHLVDVDLVDLAGNRSERIIVGTFRIESTAPQPQVAGLDLDAATGPTADLDGPAVQDEQLFTKAESADLMRHIHRGMQRARAEQVANSLAKLLAARKGQPTGPEPERQPATRRLLSKLANAWQTSSRGWFQDFGPSIQQSLGTTLRQTAASAHAALAQTMAKLATPTAAPTDPVVTARRNKVRSAAREWLLDQIQKGWRGNSSTEVEGTTDYGAAAKALNEGGRFAHAEPSPNRSPIGPTIFHLPDPQSPASHATRAIPHQALHAPRPNHSAVEHTAALRSPQRPTRLRIAVTNTSIAIAPPPRTLGERGGVAGPNGRSSPANLTPKGPNPCGTQAVPQGRWNTKVHHDMA